MAELGYPPPYPEAYLTTPEWDSESGVWFAYRCIEDGEQFSLVLDESGLCWKATGWDSLRRVLLIGGEWRVFDPWSEVGSGGIEDYKELDYSY